MTNGAQKEFHLEKFDRNHAGSDEDPTVVTIRQATQQENKLREEYISKLKNEYTEKYADFIKFGYKSYKEMWYEVYVHQDDYIDDTHNRLSLIRGWLGNTIAHYEITLTIAACNIVEDDGKTPYIKFDNGYIIGSLPSLYDDMVMEMHEKVIEMNPSWSGELDRIMMHLIKTTGATVIKQEPGNFIDLAMKSIFVKSKSHLISLMKEIHRDVFDNEGSVDPNVPHPVLVGNTRDYEFAIKKTNPPLENIILFPVFVGASRLDREKYIGVIEHGKYEIRVIAKHRGFNLFPVFVGASRLDREKYIGVIEHGKYEIRVIAKHRGFNYWDTTIEDIIPTLRTAIQWYQRKAVKPGYTREELEALNDLNEDTSWMDEAMDTGDELSEYYDDD